jgi:UDP-N-acetylmuramoyl-tripeptide--D-alanyl-D-alanine ligase
LHLPLERLSERRRKRSHHVTFIGVTGSCGKTTTASLVGTVLSSAGKCCIGAGDNNHEAIVRNVLSINASTRFCVQELSGSKPGRIAHHVNLLRPQIGIITTIGTDHYRNFRSLEATAKEKGQLVERLPEKGTAILNADDEHVRAMVSRTKARVITYGRSPDADVRATEVYSVWPDRLSLTVLHEGKIVPMRTRLVGTHWASSVLAAITCGIVSGIDLDACVRAIENFEPMFGRYSVHARPNGAIYVFDHKSPVWTIPFSLAFIKEARAPRKTMVFGTISDYPGAAARRYRKIAVQALEAADRVVFVGRQAGHVTRLQGDAGRDRLFAFETTYQASAFLAQDIEPEELMFIKGSIKADHLERIMLSQLDQVVCWRERCGKECACLDCSEYRTPTSPPYALVRRRCGKECVEGPYYTAPGSPLSSKTARTL